MAAFLFTCPRTNLKVQHWLDDDEDVPENEYEAIQCQACARLHRQRIGGSAQPPPKVCRAWPVRLSEMLER
jgi:hypothetical protein